MTFMNDRGQREADEFAERMQRELEAGRSAESRDHEPVVKPMRDTWSDMDTGFHPKHTFGRK